MPSFLLALHLNICTWLSIILKGEDLRGARLIIGFGVVHGVIAYFLARGFDIEDIVGVV